MNRRSILRAIQASRRPHPCQTILAEALPRRSPSAFLSIGETFVSAFSLMPVDLSPKTMLIPDTRANGNPGPRITHSVASALAQASTVTIGLPNDLGSEMLRRWRSLASSAGAGVLRLGEAGWDRVEFGDRSLILENGDFPAELRPEMSVVGLSRPSGAGSVALWTEIVHPNTSLRARATGSALVELAMGVDATYLVCGQIGSCWMAAAAEPAITAELVARGLEQLRKRITGVETTGPWEDPGVQHLSSLGEAVPEVSSLVLDVRLEDNANEGTVRQLAEMLGWQYKITQR